ncbi:MAG: hypothetical protein AAFX87_27210 [Bacteroidota bacterium]
MSISFYNDDKVLKKLESLFTISSPKRLKESISYVFFQYLMSSKSSLPDDFQEVASDFYFLIHFLQEVGDINREKPCQGDTLIENNS